MTLFDSELIKLLIPAIENKQIIGFWYRPILKECRRWIIVEPYLVGQLLETARVCLSAWEKPLHNHISIPKSSWNLYNLTEISGLEIYKEQYLERDTYDSDDRRMSVIFCSTR